MGRLLGMGSLAALLYFFCTLASADVAVPELRKRVTDLSGTLSAAQTSMLEQKLAAFEQTSGSQIALLMVPTTQPEEIEQYSIRAVDAWKLGRKKIDDGVLLLIARDDHRMRIEVGRGLEGALPDAIAKRIIAETLTPHFKRGDFYGGIDAALMQMMGVIQGEALPQPPPRRARNAGGNDHLGALLMPFFILWGLGHLLKRLFGTLPASSLVGVGTGVVATFLLGSVALAFGAGVLAMIAAMILYSGASGGLPGGYRGRGGFFGGGGFGGGFGGGGGGFGGGGGGFSGGGASGSW